MVNCQVTAESYKPKNENIENLSFSAVFMIKCGTWNKNIVLDNVSSYNDLIRKLSIQLYPWNFCLKVESDGLIMNCLTNSDEYDKMLLRAKIMGRKEINIFVYLTQNPKQDEKRSWRFPKKSGRSTFEIIQEEESCSSSDSFQKLTRQVSFENKENESYNLKSYCFKNSFNKAKQYVHP
jgi:hypothetical protein